MKPTIWLDVKGRARIDAKVRYIQGNPVVVISVKTTSLGTDPVRQLYTDVNIPSNRKDRSEMLRNMAMMYAMGLGIEFKLRSKKL